ncbi:PilN domain-containing protein [Vibrio marisflavi]|uniref:Fimbrial assembly protein (PilN) n=1 Tax=Vibrio marisflavi CECT 7928 TaxID=634439 RepID=A0ABM9A866_9VIBR|nr:PilN domain-containing protein [Vibrio marisflavi]CAH0541676.1 hypothetical protein VMF7928_03742 [Vibrio marisflavi CECT 7928]
MRSINLLPWRERIAKTNRQQLLVSGLVGVAVALVSLFFASSNLQRQLQIQQSRNSYLTSQIQRFEHSSKNLSIFKNQLKYLNEKNTAYSEFEKQRNLPVLLMNLLSNIASRELYFEKIIASNVQIEISGASVSHNGVASLLDRMKAIPIIREWKVRSVSKSLSVKIKETYSFHISVYLTQGE